MRASKLIYTKLYGTKESNCQQNTWTITVHNLKTKIITTKNKTK